MSSASPLSTSPALTTPTPVAASRWCSSGAATARSGLSACTYPPQAARVAHGGGRCWNTQPTSSGASPAFAPRSLCWVTLTRAGVRARRGPLLRRTPAQATLTHGGCMLGQLPLASPPPTAAHTSSPFTFHHALIPHQPLLRVSTTSSLFRLPPQLYLALFLLPVSRLTTAASATSRLPLH